MLTLPPGQRERARPGFYAICTLKAEPQLKKELAMSQQSNAIQTGRVLYAAKTHTTGGREGASCSSDGRLDVKLSTPGTARVGTNPEQLFAAGWSACFEGAMGIAARKRKVTLPADLAIDAEVDLNLAGSAYFLGARLNVSLPGVEREIAQALVDAAHQTCPYSKATRGNIDVAINLILDGHTILPAGVYLAGHLDQNSR
jgi:osmotically inducible protein OsmC